MCSVYIYVIVLQWNDTTHYISAAAYPSWSWNSCEIYEDKFYYGFWLVGGFMPRCLNREVQWKREHRPIFCKKACVKKTFFWIHNPIDRTVQKHLRTFKRTFKWNALLNICWITLQRGAQSRQSGFLMSQRLNVEALRVRPLKYSQRSLPM